MSASIPKDTIFLEDDVVSQITEEIEQLAIAEKNGATVDYSGGSGFNSDDEQVIKELVGYSSAILPTGTIPGGLRLNTLTNVAYDPTSAFAKKTHAKKETYFAKFIISYSINNTSVDSKYCSVKGALIDLLPRPLAYGDKPNSYSTEYVAIYFPSVIIDQFKTIIQDAGFLLDSHGLNYDKSQGLISINANYSTDEVPRLGIHRKMEQQGEDGEITERSVLDKKASIETMYKSIHNGGGALFKGYAFGEFGVSKSVGIGAAPPPSGSTLKLTFKLLGFHVLSRCTTIRAIKSKSIRSKFGV